VLENSKNLLKNLKQDKNLTLSQALEKKDIRIMSECGIASFNNDSKLSQIDTTINPHERNIESNNNTALVNDTNSQSMNYQNNSGMDNLKKKTKIFLFSLQL
jgi:nanoRNase/pAp phosphatase (c-di-AMP/oligoRNAs hydrolase)